MELFQHKKRRTFTIDVCTINWGSEPLTLKFKMSVVKTTWNRLLWKRITGPLWNVNSWQDYFCLNSVVQPDEWLLHPLLFEGLGCRSLALCAWWFQTRNQNFKCNHHHQEITWSAIKPSSTHNRQEHIYHISKYGKIGIHCVIYIICPYRRVHAKEVTLAQWYEWEVP